MEALSQSTRAIENDRGLISDLEPAFGPSANKDCQAMDLFHRPHQKSFRPTRTSLGMPAEVASEVAATAFEVA